MVKFHNKNRKTIEKNIIELSHNPVEEFLNMNRDIIYSTRRIGKLLNFPNKKVIFYAKNSHNIINNSPTEVGSNKTHLEIYSYKN